MKTWAVVICLVWPRISVAQQGTWEQWFNFGNTQADRIVAVHLVHVFDGTRGKVLGFGYETQVAQNCPGGGTAASDLAKLWSFPLSGAPGPGSFDGAPLCRTFMFCEGHSALADGRILNVGGMIVVPPNNPPLGTPQANLFYPLASIGAQVNTSSPPPDMFQGRWYPTGTTLPDGNVLVTSGLDENGALVTVPELYCDVCNANP